MSDTRAPRAVFTLEPGARSPEHVEVVSFRGREAVSKLFSWDVLAHEPAELADSLEADVLGRPARLVVRGLESVRCVRGIVQSVAVLDRHHRADRVFYRVRISPRLWALTRTRHTRIFQDKTVEEVIDAVLAPHRVAHRWELQRRYAPRGYCVQYDESDLHFVRRLLAEEGMFFFFAAPPPEAALDVEEEVIFADSAWSYPAIRGDVVLPFRDPDREQADREFVSGFGLRGRLREGAVRLREYDFRTPGRMLEAEVKAQGPAAALSLEQSGLVYDHHMEFEADDVGAAAARTQLEQYRVGRVFGRGASRSPRLAAGSWFALEEATVGGHDQRYVVAQVEHRGENPAAEGATDVDARPVVYENDFWCAPAAVALRPRAIRNRLKQVMETAVVVGPAGEEIHTDPYGRIKVQFHWDLDGRHDEHSSCWIRPMQSWAGSSWGFQFIPRVGMEVLVLFVGGDVDRPMVVGAAYNGVNVPPFALPQEKSRSGIRTHSTVQADGYNELSFEDLAGREQVRLRAQRDLDEHVLHDHTRAVGHDQTFTVGGEQRETITGAQTLRVGALRTVQVGGAEDHAVAGSRTVRVGMRQQTVVGGNARTEVMGDRQDQVGGSFRTRVVGAHNTEVAGNLSERVEGDRRVEVSGRSVTSVQRDALVSVRGNHAVVVTGEHSVSVAGASSSRGTGDVSVHTTKNLSYAADESITFACGSSAVRITPDEVQVVAKKLTFKGLDEVLVRGGSGALMRLHGAFEVTATDVKVKGPGAALSLGGTASLTGAQVSLGNGAGASTREQPRDASSSDEPREWVFTLHEPAATAGSDPVPMANTAVTATGHGPEPWSGSTDGNGVLRLPVVYKRCVIRVEAGRYTFELRAGALAGVDDPAQAARERLYNRGHGPGDVDGWSKDDLRDAVGSYQAARGETVSGLLLDDTLASLRGPKS
ncbi:MAG: type VI secretion system tip protein TssI/VgrG [Polyangiales bacterium]